MHLPGLIALSLESELQDTATLTIIFAFAGYLVTFLSTRMLARRQDKLRLVNMRLNEFYGPLYVASQAGNIAYNSLLNRQGKNTERAHHRRRNEGVDALDDHHLHAAE